MRSFLVNPDDLRLHAGWRLLLQLLLLFAIAFVFSMLVSPFNLSNEYSLYLGPLFSGASILLSIMLMSRFVDYRSFKGFGVTLNTTSLKEFGLGSALGLIAITLIWILLITLGFAQFNGFEWQAETSYTWILNVLSFLGLMIIVGFYEELWTRGYQLKVLAEALHFGPVSKLMAISLSMIITSLVFGLLHIANPGATLISSINISLAGVMLSLPYVLTGRLWLSIGIHFGWNFAQGGLFGFPVSGVIHQHSIVNTSMTGPEWFTGGGFGPEAGAVCLLLLLLMSIYILLRYKKTSIVNHSDAFLDLPDLLQNKVKQE